MAEQVNATLHKQELAACVLPLGSGEEPRVQVVITDLEMFCAKGVNIWKCRKSDTTRCVDILIIAKGCFGPLSCAEIFILKVQQRHRRTGGPGESNAMFWNGHSKQPSATATSSRRQQQRTGCYSSLTDSNKIRFTNTSCTAHNDLDLIQTNI